MVQVELWIRGWFEICFRGSDSRRRALFDFSFKQYYRGPSNINYNIGSTLECQLENIIIFKSSDIMIHGQKKSQKHKSEEQLKEENQLSTKISQKLSEFFLIRKQPIQTQKIPQLMEFTSILMQLCNDIATIFNYRRELVNKLLDQSVSPEARSKILGGDLKLVSKIMLEDPKSYTLWSYRQWLILKLFDMDKSIIDKQKQLCKMMLMKDEKNFHVWNYRNWVNSIGLNVEAELQFTKSKINSNPFNFSPYHFRSKYLIKKYDLVLLGSDLKQKQEILTYGMPKDILDEEFQMIKTAIFLNPKEEAPWLYYSWLLKQLLPARFLDISPGQQDKRKYTLLFSQKVQNPKSLIQCDQQFNIHSNNTSSCSWTLEFSEDFVGDIRVHSSGQGDQLVKTETTCRRIIGNSGKQDDISQIQQIYARQQEFIKEVIDSQEKECRFGWLQLLQLINNSLYLGVSELEWEQKTSESVKIFEELLKQKKGLKYIQKQYEYWKRLASSQNLTPIQIRLISATHK